MTDDRAEPLESAGKPWRDALIIIALSTLLRLALGAVVPLFPDEAYYWEWSRHLAGGYFDHPPAIAWLIAGGTTLLGDTPLGVRLLPIFAGSVAMLALVRASLHLAGSRAARYAALLLACLPLTGAGLILATPDAPLLAGIAWTLYAVIRAIDTPLRSGASTRWWIIAGLAIGAAMTSKFTGVFVPLALMIAFLVHAPLRARFREPGPWLAVAVASLAMIPVLTWNATHDWIAFRFQFRHGLGTSTRESWMTRELRLVGGQFAIVTPILLPLLVGATWRALRAPRDAPRFALAVVVAFCAAFFVYSATRRSVEPNWPALVWIPAIVLLASVRSGPRTAWERRAAWLVGVVTAILLVHVVHPVLPLPARRDQVSRAHGWDALGRSVDSARAASGTLHIAANRYQDAAKLAFHLPGHPPVVALNLVDRRNQYDLWPRFPDRANAGDDLLLLLEPPREGLPGPIRRLTGHFAVIDSGTLITLLRDGERVGSRRLWHLQNWAGTWPADSTDPLRRFP